MRHLFLRVAFVLIAATPFLKATEISDRGSPSVITAKARDFARVLDEMDVEKYWQPGIAIHWKTGKHDPQQSQHATHCSAFVAAACERFGVYILRPPDHSQVLLANAQQKWLLHAGEKDGWRQVKSWSAAQRLANEGEVVVASYRNPDPDKPGHVALVRPSTRSQESITRDGPEFIWAGKHNHNRGSLEECFHDHKDHVLFFVHRPEKRPIRVAVYAGEGAGLGLDAVLKVLAHQPEFAVHEVKGEAIRQGQLARYDVLIVPGGSGSKEARGLGEKGREQVQEFVRKGGGYLGICAGAYLATCDYPWALNILNARVLDKEHWDRGNGKVEIALSQRGREVLGARQDMVSIHYAQGPILAPAHHKGLPDYEVLARFHTQVAKNGAPRDVMPGATAVAAAEFGKGRVLCFSPHPEETDGLHKFLLGGIMWAAAR
jgi:glutamine amidotransferase-like uncharacterized protein